MQPRHRSAPPLGGQRTAPSTWCHGWAVFGLFTPPTRTIYRQTACCCSYYRTHNSVHCWCVDHIGAARDGSWTSRHWRPDNSRANCLLRIAVFGIRRSPWGVVGLAGRWRRNHRCTRCTSGGECGFRMAAFRSAALGLDRGGSGRKAIPFVRPCPLSALPSRGRAPG